MEQPLDRLVAGDTGGDEDRRDDEEAGQLLAAVRAEQEGDPERHGGQRVADVVDQVGEQRDRCRRRAKIDGLERGGQAEDRRG